MSPFGESIIRKKGQTKAAIYQSQGTTFLNNQEKTGKSVDLIFSFLNGHQRSIILSKYFILSLHSLVNVCVQEVSEPTKEEKAVAKYLRFNCPTKSTNMMGHRVDYFIGECFVVFCPCQRTTSWTGGSATRGGETCQKPALCLWSSTQTGVFTKQIRFVFERLSLNESTAVFKSLRHVAEQLSNS